jgi:hypothetical protein
LNEGTPMAMRIATIDMVMTNSVIVKPALALAKL